MGGYHRRTPLSAVAWWWKLLADADAHAVELADAVITPAVWSQGSRAADDRLAGMSMTSVVQYGDHASPGTAWVMFTDLSVSTSARALAPIPTHDTPWVEVVRSEDGLWRVSGTVERPGGTNPPRR